MEQAILNNNILEEPCTCCDSVTLSISGPSFGPYLFYGGTELEVSNTHVWQMFDIDTSTWETFQTGGVTPLVFPGDGLIRIVHTEPNGCVYISNVFFLAAA